MISEGEELSLMVSFLDVVKLVASLTRLLTSRLVVIWAGGCGWAQCGGWRGESN